MLRSLRSGARVALSFVVVGGMMAVFAGCAGGDVAEPDVVTTTRAGPEVADVARVVGAVDGRIVGDVGPAEDVDAAALHLSTWDGDSVVTFENVVATADRFVMLYASVTQPEVVLQPGARTYVREARVLGVPSVVMLGCTGREEDLFDEYDAVADEVDVVVEPVVPDASAAVELDDGAAIDDGVVDLRVAVTARWLDRGQMATSSFRLVR
jgi:hypothetical protein